MFPRPLLRLRNDLANDRVSGYVPCPIWYGFRTDVAQVYGGSLDALMFILIPLELRGILSLRFTDLHHFPVKKRRNSAPTLLLKLPSFERFLLVLFSDVVLLDVSVLASVVTLDIATPA